MKLKLHHASSTDDSAVVILRGESEGTRCEVRLYGPPEIAAIYPADYVCEMILSAVEASAAGQTA